MWKLSKAMIVLLAVILAAPAMSQADAQKAANCSVYARNQAEVNSGGGGRIIGGAMGGALGGGVFGAIVGGRRGARRGVALGAVVGGLRSTVNSGNDSEMRYQQYFNSCMQG